MCGRYHVDEEILQEIQEVVREVDRKLQIQGERDVWPNQEALVLLDGPSGLQARQMYWGFPGYDQKRLLINARSETVLEKRTFRESAMLRRCVIPARHFYEWDSRKNKVCFRRQSSRAVYMAGIYRCVQGEDRFVILTTGANESVKAVHDRMPFILEPRELDTWVTGEGIWETLLWKVQPQLESFREYEQQRLPF